MNPVSTAKLALLTAASIPVMSTAHASITFVIEGTEGDTSFTQTVGGVTLTLTPVVHGQFAFGDLGGTPGDLVLSGPNFGLTHQFTFSFSTDVQVLSYVVGSTTTALGTFDLVSSSSTSLANPLSPTGSHTVNGTFLIAGNTSGTFTANIADTDGTAGLHSITIDCVPEPGTMAAAAFASLAVGGAAWRHARSPAWRTLPGPLWRRLSAGLIPGLRSSIPSPSIHPRVAGSCACCISTGNWRARPMCAW